MYLDKETYERAGLAGRPQGAKGNRGLKPRWSALPMSSQKVFALFALLKSRSIVVSYDLRNPSMLHGKRGFDRLLFASKKVLNQSLTWLFCNVTESSKLPRPVSHFLYISRAKSNEGQARLLTRCSNTSPPSSPQLQA